MRNDKHSGPIKTPPKWLKIINPNRKNSISLKKIKPIFILSTGRTGTTYLAKYFSYYPNIYAVHEPKPSRRMRQLSMARLQEVFNDDQYLAKILNQQRQNMIKHSGKIYIESNPFLVGFAKALPVVFDSPTLIHVVRDPRDYITSGINHGALKGTKKFLNNHLKYWLFDVEKKDGESDRTHMVRRLATFWTVSNNFIASAGKDVPNYHLVKFESLFNDKNNIDKLARKIDLPNIKLDQSRKLSSAQSKNQSQFRTMPEWPDWTAQEKKIVEKICGSTMLKFNYSLK